GRAAQPLRRRDRLRPPPRRHRRAADGPARLRLPRTAERPLRPHRALHRHGHGRLRHLGEPCCLKMSAILAETEFKLQRVYGDVEIALHCSARTISTSVRHFASPEVLLGIIPAWGGTQLIPQLAGPELAVKMIVENPLRQNRMLSARQAVEARLADRLLEPVE